MQGLRNSIQPEQLSDSQLQEFTLFCERSTGERFADFAQFEAFAVQNYRTFWRCFLDWSEILYSGDPDPICTSDDCKTAEFFPRLRVNLTENLLRIRDAADAARPALTSIAPGRAPIRLTRGVLRSRVEQLSQALSARGVSPGSRVALVAHNDHAAVTAVLAAAALGAVVGTGSIDLSGEANLERLGGFRPEVLFCHVRSTSEVFAQRQRDLVAFLAASLPSLRLIVTLDDGEAARAWQIDSISLDELMAIGGTPGSWPRLPFDQPYDVLFTSGTSGPPRGIVHGAGGTLLEQLKAIRLHYDLRASDKIFWQSSTSWVLWRFHLSMLALGAEIVVNCVPVSHPETLWKIVAEEKITSFATAPAYLTMCQLQGYSPRSHFDFSALRSIIAGGSILEEAQQEWARREVKPLTVRSGYGSTEVNTAVLLPNPLMGDYPGQIQSRGIGLDMRAVRQGESSFAAPAGELVIANPFPSRPLGYYDDPDKVRFHADYFVRNAPYWNQGDFAEFTAEGGVRVLGRSDSVVNIRGIRIGPAEIYKTLSAVPEIGAAMAVAQSGDMPGGERLLLFVVLQKGLTLTDSLSLKIKDHLRSHLSASYVPEVVAQVAALPMTFSGKISERAGADAVSGRPIANRSALRNPESLDAIADHPALREVKPSPTVSGTDGAESQSVEAIIRGIWEDVLNRRPIGHDEVFFDLGGDSARAMEVFTRIEKAFDAELPISILHRAPTIAKLAEHLRQDLAPTHETLVLLADRPGPQPLFFVHGLGGHVMELRPLMRAIEVPGPIYGIQARGVSGEAEPLRSVTEMARLYVAAIRERQPLGPYLIGGYSQGGIIALEMARILLAANESVLPIIMLDTLIDSKYWKTSDWLRMLRSRLYALVRDAGAAGPRQFLQLGARRAMGLVKHLLRRYDTDVRRRYAPLYEDRHSMPPSLWAVREAGIEAFGAYAPRFLDQDVYFLKAEHGVYNWCDPTALWLPYLRSIKVEQVPGNHLSMLVHPACDALARAVSRFLAATVAREIEVPLRRSVG